MLRLICITCLALAGAVSCAPQAPGPAPETGPVAVIEALTEAFNAHDPAAMRQFWHEDVQWLDPVGTDMPVLYTSAEALQTDMGRYFESLPDVSVELESISTTGNWVTAIERPSWTDGEGNRKSQAAIAVYEVIDGKVKRFWYFPSTE